MGIHHLKNYEIRLARLSGASNGPLIISMCTPDYIRVALRLCESINKNTEFDFIVFETPTVHKSITPKGSSFLEYSKPSLIAYCLEKYGRSVVYLDSDVIIEQTPLLLNDLFAQNFDFSIYNWLSGEENHCYVPINDIQTETLYHFSHKINKSCPNQLICSGAVQFWAPTEKAHTLLNYWFDFIELEPNFTDDIALDFAFNNNTDKLAGMRCLWLPKSYARYAWWIFDKPIINHPYLPNKSNKSIIYSEARDQLRYYQEFFTEMQMPAPIADDELIDIKTKIIYKIISNELVATGYFKNEIWK